MADDAMMTALAGLKAGLEAKDKTIASLREAHDQVEKDCHSVTSALSRALSDLGMPHHNASSAKASVAAINAIAEMASQVCGPCHGTGCFKGPSLGDEMCKTCDGEGLAPGKPLGKRNAELRKDLEEAKLAGGPGLSRVEQLSNELREARAMLRSAEGDVKSLQALNATLRSDEARAKEECRKAQDFMVQAQSMEGHARRVFEAEIGRLKGELAKTQVALAHVESKEQKALQAEIGVLKQQLEAAGQARRELESAANLRDLREIGLVKQLEAAKEDGKKAVHAQAEKTSEMAKLADELRGDVAALQKNLLVIRGDSDAKSNAIADLQRVLAEKQKLLEMIREKIEDVGGPATGNMLERIAVLVERLKHTPAPLNGSSQGNKERVALLYDKLCEKASMPKFSSAQTGEQAAFLADLLKSAESEVEARWARNRRG